MGDRGSGKGLPSRAAQPSLEPTFTCHRCQGEVPGPSWVRLRPPVLQDLEGVLSWACLESVTQKSKGHP